MLIQAILIAIFTALLISFLRRQGSYQVGAWTKILTAIFAIVAILVIVFPESSNRAAHFVGVTRGADLLLYMLIPAFLFLVLSLYVNRKKDQQKLVLLARKIALLEATRNYPRRRR